jgi:hypothetical protein
MSGRYAQNTDVTADRSRAQLEKELQRYGARGFGYMTEGDQAAIMFSLLNEDGSLLRVKLTIPVPDENDPAFTKTPTGNTRGAVASRRAWEQACRSRWRSVLLVVKAKLEAVDVGISTIEREFMPDLILSDGRTLETHLGGREFTKQIEAGGALRLLESK